MGRYLLDGELMPPRSKEDYEADEQWCIEGRGKWCRKFESDNYVASVWLRHEEAGGTCASEEEPRRGGDLHMAGFNPHGDSDDEGWGGDW
eukprot:1870861-Rhodomonas_salina.1